VSVVTRRYSADLSVAFLLAVAAGVIAFLWEAHDLGRSCGYRAGFGLPSFPVRTAFVVLVGSSAALSGVRAGIAGRSPWVIAALSALAAVLAAVATGAAVFLFAASRHCFE
jgi:hypothetical protein